MLTSFVSYYATRVHDEIAAEIVRFTDNEDSGVKRARSEARAFKGRSRYKRKRWKANEGAARGSRCEAGFRADARVQVYAPVCKRARMSPGNVHHVMTPSRATDLQRGPRLGTLSP